MHEIEEDKAMADAMEDQDQVSAAVAEPMEDVKAVGEAQPSGAKAVLRGGLKHTWKGHGDQFSKHISRFIREDGEKKLWERKKEERERRKADRETEKAMRQKKSEELKKKREKQRLKEERKKENLIRAGGIQVIKNTVKIKQWSKKAQKQLIKMPAELVEKYLGKNV